MKASYPDCFKKLLDDFKGSAPNNYIGQGNPGANILIVGKETTTTEEPFVTFETYDNFATWQKNQRNQIDFSDVPDWETSPLHFHEKYNPLFPYNSHRVGWSKTWDGYQKFINHLLPADMVAKSGQHYNFWQYSFITELSTNNQKHSPRKWDEETAKSIEARLKSDFGILRADFFQEFPIIILGCYHYKDIYKIDIPTCFNQTYIGLAWKHKRLHEFIHAHRHISEDGKPHLLLHTNHFAMRSHDFLKAVADKCKKFMDEYGISILKSEK